MKLLSALSLLLLPISLFAQTLVGSWQFNGNANDASGNNLNGTIYNAVPSAGITGAPNTAYKFDGSSAHIDVPYNPILNLTTWTIQAMLKFHGFNSSTCQAEFIVSRGRQFSGDFYMIGLNDNTYDNSCGIASPTHNQFIDQGPSTASSGWHLGNFLDTNIWYCHTATYDGNMIRVYWDGTRVDSAIMSAPYNYTGSSPVLAFGYYPNGGAGFPYWLNADVDYINIWSGVMTLPPALNVSQHFDTICLGQSATLTAAGNNLIWSPATGLNTTAGNTVSASPAITTTYYISSSGIGCQHLVDSITVTVFGSVSPTITAPSSACVGSPVSLSTQPFTGGTYQWSGPNGFVSNIQSPNIPSATTTNSGTYNLTVTTSTGCVSAVASAVIAVNAIPAAPTTSNLSYCQFSTAVPLTATTAPGGTLQWYTTATGGAASASIIPSTSASGATTYYVSQVVNGCTSPRAPLNVTIIPQPAIPTATTSYIYCQGDPVTQITATGQNLQWYNVSTGGAGSSTAPSISSGIADTTSYYVSQTVNGCTSNRQQITVMVKPKPQPPAVTDTNYCIGSPQLTLASNGTNLIWYTPDTATTGSATAPTFSANATPGNFIYAVTQTVNGCQSNKSRVRVEVDKLPVVSVNVPPRTVLCQYDTISFIDTANIINGYTYLWTIPTAATLVSGGLNSAYPILVSFNNYGHDTVRLTATNRLCVATVTYVVPVTASPDANVTVKKQVCVGDIVTVNISDKRNVTNYTVALGGGNILSGTNSSDSYTGTWKESGTYVVTVNLAPGTANLCGNSPITDTVIVHPLPVAHISASNAGAVICEGDSVAMTATGTAFVNTYEWQPAPIFRGADKLMDPIAVPDNSTEIYLTVTSTFGCTTTDSLYIAAKACCGVYFPNAFTPNQDGKNDIFRPITGANQKFELFRVENRWGQMVYQGRTMGEGWDGRFNGVPQGIGTYYFVFKYLCDNGREYLQKGSFELIR